MTDTFPDTAPDSLAHFPMPRTSPFDPPPQYQPMRESGRAVRVRLAWGGTTWLLTRSVDIRRMLNDARFSSNRLRPSFPFLVSAPLTGPRTFKPSIINMDPPEHGTVRHQVAGEYSLRRLEQMRPRIQEIVNERFDALLAGPNPADLVATVALPVPSLVICGQLGVPYADHEFFQARSLALLRRQTALSQRQRAVDELQDYLYELITAKARHPEDDLLSWQVSRQRESGTVDVAGLASLAVLLLVAGHETTSNMIGLSTLFLLANPHLHAELADTPTAISGAVEELLRYLSVAEVATARVAVEDVEIAGVLIRAGEGVIGLCHAGNRDPAAFTNPDAFDIHRARGRQHLAFGFGPHQCIGQNLARLELHVYLTTLLRRVPHLRLAAAIEDLRFKHDAAVFGPYELPVTW